MINGLNKCRVCENYLNGIERCKFCEFEWAKEYPPCDDKKFDILNLDDDIEWSHLQIIDRLYYKGIQCLTADIWWDGDLAYIIGVKANIEKVADALGLHKEVIFNDSEMGLMILNLYKERHIRGLI